jgi:hypothetical protein
MLEGKTLKTQPQFYLGDTSLTGGKKSFNTRNFKAGCGGIPILS